MDIQLLATLLIRRAQQMPYVRTPATYAMQIWADLTADGADDGDENDYDHHGSDGNNDDHYNEENNPVTRPQTEFVGQLKLSITEQHRVAASDGGIALQPFISALHCSNASQCMRIVYSGCFFIWTVSRLDSSQIILINAD